MMKRIIALLLALILTVGLLPTVALAATTETSVSKTEETHQDNLNLVKTVTEDGDNYKVKLEAWATGKTVIDETKIPLDIVLVLDESGSMEEDFTTTESTQYVLQRDKKNKKYKEWADSGNLFFKDINGNFYQVTVTVNGKEYVYTYKNSAGQDVLIGRSSGKYKNPHLNLYRKYTTTTVLKNKALKDAANSFIDAVYGEAVQYKLNHRIAIVTYSNNAQIRSGGQQAKNAFVTVNTTGNRDSLKGNVNNLQTSGSTYIDKGIQTANSIFAENQFKDGTRARVMIVFTDGGPGQNGEWTKSGDSHSTANNAISYAKTAIGTYKATVYTIGIFDGAAVGNPTSLPPYYTNPSGWDAASQKASNSNRFMHLVSSNYPGATRMNAPGSINENLGENKSYYLAASSAGALSDVFETINEEISTDTTTLGEEALIIDKIPGNFAIPANAQGITLTVANYKADGSFEAATTAPAGVTAKYENNTATVTGFDFSDNWCGVDQDGKAHGQKLIIEFTIKHNNYGGTQPTNNGAGIADKDGLEIIKVSDPKVLVKISAPADIFAQEIEKTYDGIGFNILNKVAEKANSLADGTKNKFVDIEVKVTVDGTDYTYTIKAGQTAGTWNQAGTPKTSPNVKETTLGTAENYEYPVTITFKDAAKGSNASNSTDTNAKFKINYAEAKVKANNKSKKATEEDPAFDATVTGMVNGEKAEEKLTYTITRTDASDNTVGDHQTITPIGDTYQNNYKVTYETGTLTITKGDPTATEFSLTGKFQKTLNSNTADVSTAGKEFELKITGATPNTNTTSLTGKVTDMTPVKVTGTEDQYTITKSFFGENDKLTFNKEGTYTYTVQEVKPAAPVAGMKYDETIYTLTIEVTESNGALSVTSAKVTKPGTTDQPEQVADLLATTHDSFTITNTFTAAELPLDPPTDPVQGTAKIVKALSSDSDTPTVDLPFKASLTGGIGFARRVARATVKAGEKTADFSGFGTLVFTEEKVYEYEIYEETTGSDRIPGVRYDQTRYTLKVDVRENTTNHELYINSAQYTAGQVEGNILTTPITFTNKYTKPENATVVSKTVVTDLSTLSSPMRNAIHNFESINETTILYPVANNGTNTLEVTKGTTTARLLYKISVDAGTQQSLWFDDANVDAFWYKVDEVAVSRAGSRFKVEFKNNVRTADIYVTVNHTLNFDKGKCTVENAIGEIKATTTVTEKDPNKLTINFADYVQKELTATGSKTASDVNFTVNVKESPIHVINSTQGGEAVSTYAGELLSTTLNAHFDSITGGETKTTPFTGSVEITSAGQYIFELREEDGQRTGVTYDETIYTLHVLVDEKEGSLAVTRWYFTDSNRVEHNAGEKAAFHNTIDTGKDDYYPIIIPTIINKDTGMLNKTDHFAYVIGYPDGTVHPNGQITRAEVATIFFRLLRDEVRDGAFTTSNSYSDVAYGKWYNNPISTMSALGIITGYPDGTFKPNKPITRAEFAAIAARFDETQSGKSATFSDVIGHWAAKEIGIAYYNDWIKGYPDGTFKPDQNITRAEAMTLINRVLERKPESPADLLTNMNKWTDNLDTSKWYYLDVQEATNSHGYTRKTFNYELWRQMLPDPDWSRYER